MSYNHNKKAGNPGDVVKHVALIAAVDAVLVLLENELSKKKRFEYCDTYAANALNLLKGEMEFEDGIGKIPEGWLPENAHLKLWKNLWVKYQNPGSVPFGFYPGSSYFVFETLRAKEVKSFKFNLWDINIDCIRNQYEIFANYTRNQGLHPNPKVSLHPESAFNKNNELEERFRSMLSDADFLFVDPPSLKCLPGGYLNLASERANKSKWTMFWLPVSQNNQGMESNNSKRLRENYYGANVSTIVIQYGAANGGAQSLLGCQIFLAGPPPAEGNCPVRAAVKNSISAILDAGNGEGKFFKDAPSLDDGLGIEEYAQDQWGLPFGWTNENKFVGNWSDEE